MDANEEPTIYVVSDGRGETGAQLVRAALVQFEGQRYRITIRPNVRSIDRVREVVEEAAGDRAVVFYTLVSAEARSAMRSHAEAHLVPATDLLGPAFSLLDGLFHSSPRAIPGLLYASEKDYFDRIEAIDYTLKHDDGQRPHELGDADLVLVGVSRASKSSTCFFLAYQCYRAANVPLIPNIPPPPELLALDPGRVVGLTINTTRLKWVRQARAQSLRLGELDPYTDPREIGRELRAAEVMMSKYGWRSIDVSYKAIEEIGKEVIRLHESG